MAEHFTPFEWVLVGASIVLLVQGYIAFIKLISKK